MDEQGQFQSTRPHGARQSRPRPTSSARSFNPRARTGRDRGRRRIEARRGVSIHAPARGATPMTYLPSGSIVSFNPRARTGRDLATATSMARVCRFNPRARTGRDRLILSTSVVASLFQSTRPHGARLAQSVATPAESRFQSTRPHGARPVRIDVAVGLLVVSIHAPARGATRARPSSTRTIRSFNPRARTGRDRGGGRCLGSP